MAVGNLKQISVYGLNPKILNLVNRDNVMNVENLIKKKEMNGCPKCNENDCVSYDSVDIDSDRALQSGYCGDCDYSWVEVYQLIGYVEN